MKGMHARFIGIFLTKTDDGVSIDVGDDSYIIKKASDEEQKAQLMSMAGLFQLDLERHNKEHAGVSMGVWLIVMPDAETRMYIKPRHIPYHWDLPLKFLEDYGLEELADIARVKGEDAKNALIKDFKVVELNIVQDKKEDDNGDSVD